MQAMSDNLYANKHVACRTRNDADRYGTAQRAVSNGAVAVMRGKELRGNAARGSELRGNGARPQLQIYQKQLILLRASCALV